MNILFTSVGRRYYLLKYFRKSLPSNVKIISTNSSKLTLAKNYSDFFYLSPKIISTDYIKFLKKLIKKHEIKLIVPLFDLDVKKLSKNINLFDSLNTILISPPYETVKIVSDKYELYNFLKKNSFNVPKTYISKNFFSKELKTGNVKFPVILKPRHGTGSILTTKVNNMKELNFFYKYISNKISTTYLEKKKIKQKIIIQEFLNGTEYGLDIFNSLEKKYHFHLLKQKLSMRSGETDACKISNKNIFNFCKKISKLLIHNFIVDIDLIIYKNKKYIIDINPRIGGGYPFTHSAGFDMINYLLNQIYKKIKLSKNHIVNSKKIFIKNIFVSEIKK